MSKLIVNPALNAYLAVKPNKDGSVGLNCEVIVKQGPIGAPHSHTVHAFWEIYESTKGGCLIRLASDNTLCIDIDAASEAAAKNGTKLVLGNVDKPKFTYSNLWGATALAGGKYGVPAVITALGVTSNSYALSSGQDHEWARIWEVNNNFNQHWQVLSIE